MSVMVKKVYAMVHSLKKQAECEIVAESDYNNVLAKYNGTYCTAIFNPFVGMYYVDDVYGVLTEVQAKQYYNKIMG